MSLSRITATIDTYQANDYSAGFGQVRNGFRHLLQSINNGYLENAQLAYKNLSRTMPAVFDKVSLKLTHDYDSIGRSLGEGNIAGAQQAVVQLKQDLQDIGRTEHISPRHSNTAGIRTSSAAASNIIRSYYSGNIERGYIGTHIDIII